MAKIDFFGLGGLDEKAKPCYALTINGNIYIINCGISAPPNTSLGIKKIIPNFDWIQNNKHAIKGIFIGYPTYESFGGIEYLHAILPNVPIYVSDIGAVILKTYFDARAKRHQLTPIKLNLRVIEPMKQEKVGTCIVTAFKVCNAMPRSLGFVFDTSDGCVIYIDQFIVSSNKNNSFDSQIFEINKITKNRNLLLLVGTGNVGKNNGFTAPNHRVFDVYDSILTDNTNNRIIVACYDWDVYKVLTLAQLAAIKARPFIVYSNTFKYLFDYVMKYQYFSGKFIHHLSDDKIDQSENSIIVITGTPPRLFAKLNKIIDEEDKKIHLKPSDAFVFSINTIPGFEKQEANISNDIARSDINKIYKLPKEIMPMFASNEDHKLLLKLLGPKYVIPVNGLYMDVVKYQRLCGEVGVNYKNVLNLENGCQISFENGNLLNNKKYIKIDPQFIGSQGSLDVGASSFFERDQMEENGVVLVSLYIQKSSKSIKRFNIDAIGVIGFNSNNKEIVDEINDTIIQTVNEFLTSLNQISSSDIKEIKIQTKKIVSKQYTKKFNKKPLVIVTLIVK